MFSAVSFFIFASYFFSSFFSDFALSVSAVLIVASISLLDNLLNASIKSSLDFWLALISFSNFSWLVASFAASAMFILA